MSTDDLKSRLSSSSSANPFAKGQQAPTPSQSFNPFAPPGGGLGGVNPGQSLNPFAAPSSGAVNPAQSLNPFAPPTTSNVQDEGTAPSPSLSLNPFAPSGMGAASPLSDAGPASLTGVRPSQSLNPFGGGMAVKQPTPLPQAEAPIVENSLNPFEAPASTSSASLNPFEAPAPTSSASVNPFGGSEPAPTIDPVAAFAQIDAERALAAESAQQLQEDRVHAAEAEQLRGLAPLNFAPSEIPLQSAELPPDLTAGLINRSLAISMTLGAAAAALIIGLLMGIVFDQRRAHNHRVDAWNNIDAKLSAALEDVDLINETIGESLKQRVIKWDLIEKLPKKLNAVPPTLTATRVPLEQKAVLELSKLIHEVNLLFADISEHRALTMASRGELEVGGERRAFEAYNFYAFDATQFLKGCERRGKLNCSLPKPGAIPTGRVVAIHNNTPDSDGKLEVVIRHEKNILKADPSYLIPIKKDQVTGFGSTPAQAYALRLKAIMDHLEVVMKTKSGFEDTLKKKLETEKVFAL